MQAVKTNIEGTDNMLHAAIDAGVQRVVCLSTDKAAYPINAMGISHYPICIAKTQYSFSADAKAYGVLKGFKINIRDIVINCGAEMLVLIAGDIMRMPGLPKSPQAERIDLTPEGEIDGLS
jgi:formate--tetrahydrofolate ligase